MTQDEYQFQVMDDDGYGCAITSDPEFIHVRAGGLGEAMARYAQRAAQEAPELSAALQAYVGKHRAQPAGQR